ncbi:unnamed protein product [Adineta steineri]|uniref:ABC transmembrane type-1 domain-containing protein n=1 Tax=Adineta steineri TaxID=433720 RepID=A0A813ZS85_9BILA|nr:unnamed protein product [Adineta steineri]
MSRRIKILFVSSSFTLFIYLLRRYRRYLLRKIRQTSVTQESLINIPSSSLSSSGISVNKRFLNQLLVIIRIFNPRFGSDAFFLLITHVTTLISRTFLSIYIARLEGAIVKSLVQRNLRDFIRTICIFLTVAVPSSFINSLIRYTESKLANNNIGFIVAIHIDDCY